MGVDYRLSKMSDDKIKCLLQHKSIWFAEHFSPSPFDFQRTEKKILRFYNHNECYFPLDGL